MGLSDVVANRMSSAAGKAFPRIGESYLKEARSLILSKVAKIAVQEKQSDAYPFLKDKEKFVRDLVSCIVWVSDEDGLVITLSKSKMASFGFPKNLPDLMEFGGRNMPQAAWVIPAGDRVGKRSRRIFREEYSKA